MKKMVQILAVSVIFLSFPVSPGVSGTLRDDYKELEGKRRTIEKSRGDYETKLRELSSKRHKINLQLYQCVSKNWKDKWEAKLKEAKALSEKLETERLALVNLRIQLDKTRNNLEKSRADIEERHKHGRGKQYEAEFREYMENLNEQYFKRVETELFEGYRQYLEDVDRYLSFLENSLEMCRNEQ